MLFICNFKLVKRLISRVREITYFIVEVKKKKDQT